MNLPLRLLIPARFRRAREQPAPPRPAPGPPPLAIDFTLEGEDVDLSEFEPTKRVTFEELEWRLAEARVSR